MEHGDGGMDSEVETPEDPGCRSSLSAAVSGIFSRKNVDPQKGFTKGHGGVNYCFRNTVPAEMWGPGKG